MIVNTAYIYMGSAGEPANPVIFQQNEINYNFSGTSYFETSTGYLRMDGISELVFTGLDLRNFEKLSITAQSSSPSRTLIINFIDNSDNVSDDISQSFIKSGLSTKSYTIPPEYKKPKSKIKLSTTTAGSNLLLNKAILS